MIDGCAEMTKKGFTKCKFHSDYIYKSDPPGPDEVAASKEDTDKISDKITDEMFAPAHANKEPEILRKKTTKRADADN